MSEGPKLKAYVSRNYDGRRMAMTAAPTMKEAAKIMRMTVGAMRSYGWYLAKDQDADLALSKPGVVFFASLTPIGGPRIWAPSS